MKPGTRRPSSASPRSEGACSSRGPDTLFVFPPGSGHCTDLPEVLRIFFRHDKRLHGEVSRLIYASVRDFTTEAVGKPTRIAPVVVFQSSGPFCRFAPHWHGLFLEGGFDHEGRLVHVPQIDL
jgi:hypothetical protein